MGSTFAARRAGTKLAANPIAARRITARARINGAAADGGDSRLQNHNAVGLHETACRAWHDDLHRRPQTVHATCRFQTRPAHPTAAHGTPQGAKSVAPLADRAIGNLQQWLVGTYHGVSKSQLQVYLDEFVFRQNRRCQPMAAFQTLLGLGTARSPAPYRKIQEGMTGMIRIDHNLLGFVETTG